MSSEPKLTRRELIKGTAAGAVAVTASGALSGCSPTTPSNLPEKWDRETDYALRKDLWAFAGNRIAVRFQYESRDADGRRRAHLRDFFVSVIVHGSDPAKGGSAQHHVADAQSTILDDEPGQSATALVTK